MALTVTHPFVSAVVDENNPGEVGPGEWNAAHSISGTLDAAQMPALTGDVTTPGASLATTLATVNGNVGTFGSATQVAQVTYNAKGLATAITNVTVTPAASSVTGGAALTKTDDTNVTLTLGGSPTQALLAASSITVGWTGTLAPARGGTGVANNAASTITISGNFGTTFTVTATTSVTLPTTGTLATLAGSETFTNKTLTSPVLTTPALGTPASGVLTNCTGLPLSSGVAGDLPFANLTQGGAYTILLNNSGSTADVAAVSISSLTEKTTLVADDLFLIQDSAASNAFKKVKWGAVGGGTLSGTLIGANKVTLTNDTAADLTSVGLTPGTWLVWGMAVFQPAASTTMKYGIGSISDTSNTINFTPPNLTYIPFFNEVVNNFATDPGFTVGPILITVGSNTTYYIVAQSGFAVAGNFAYGSIRALRIA